MFFTHFCMIKKFHLICISNHSSIFLVLSVFAVIFNEPIFACTQEDGVEFLIQANTQKRQRTQEDESIACQLSEACCCCFHIFLYLMTVSSIFTSC